MKPNDTSFTRHPDLQGKHVVITGGAGGIGVGLVEGFLLNQSKVTVIDIDEKGFEKLHQGIVELPGADESRLQFFKVDLLDISSLQKAMGEAIKKFSEVDVLVNNAANDERHELETVSLEDWDRLINLNLRHYFFAIQAVTSGMKERRSGVIINLSSNACLLGLTGYPIYVTAKAAILGMTKSLARQLGSSGIRVNALIPGWVMTEKQKQHWVTQESLKECLEQQCLKEPLEVEDIVEAALFLAGDASRMMSGQSLVVDGGRA